MISTIKGKLVKKNESSLIIDVNGIGYEVLVPLTVLNDLRDKQAGEEINLITFHYFSTDPSKGMPVLIGFTNQIEKEFFEQFITVSGVGPKAAVKALCEPISVIIQAIDSGDINTLKRLPGIGEQRAKQIIAKLQGKIGKFGLIKDSFVASELKVTRDVKEEALQVLFQLQYKRREAEDMIDEVLKRNPSINSVEELLNEVYRQKAGENT